MTIGAGLKAQIGIANEATVGTAVAVTVFTKFNSENLERRPNMAQGLGLGGGLLVPEAARRVEVSHDGGGPVAFNVPTKGLGKWLQAMIGSYDATATELGTSSGAYEQVHNTGSADGKSFTLQKGVPSIDGTVNPLTLSGCKLLDWTLDSSPNSIATLSVTVDAMDVAKTGSGALGLQTASYDGTGEFAFNQAYCKTFSAYTVDDTSKLWTPTSPASPGAVRKISLKGGQPKDAARWVAGSSTKDEALVNDFQAITGSIDIDFADMDLYDDFAGNTSNGLVIGFRGKNIASTYYETLEFIMPACFFESGSTPQVSGPGIVTVSYPFTALGDSDGNALQAHVISTDSSV